MVKMRFLRDKVIDKLIEEVERLSASIPDEDENSIEFLSHYVNSLLITFKTTKIVLERVEEAITAARKIDNTEIVYAPLCEAAMHLQVGVNSLNEALWLNTQSLRQENGNADFGELEFSFPTE
ncbi:MAG: hypothetical protein AB1656_24945 [Candidatus Omnitrophota bacterium]